MSNNVEVVDTVTGKFYNAELSIKAEHPVVQVTVDVIKLIQLYGTSLRKVRMFIPVNASVDEESVPDVEELTLDLVPVKIELESDKSERYNLFEPEVVKSGDSKDFD